MKERLTRKPEPPAVILSRPKYKHNLAAAIRACSCFGIDTLIWTDGRIEFDEGERLPREERMKGYAKVDFFRNDRPFDLFSNASPVCVELTPSAVPLTYFEHPENAVYVFGPEDGSVSQAFRWLCHHFVFIPSYHCLNLSAALNVVLQDRMAKAVLSGQLVLQSDVGGMLDEYRGEATIESVVGWDGK